MPKATVSGRLVKCESRKETRLHFQGENSQSYHKINNKTPVENMSKGKEQFTFLKIQNETTS